MKGMREGKKEGKNLRMEGWKRERRGEGRRITVGEAGGPRTLWSVTEKAGKLPWC